MNGGRKRQEWMWSKIIVQPSNPYDQTKPLILAGVAFVAIQTKTVVRVYIAQVELPAFTSIKRCATWSIYRTLRITKPLGAQATPLDTSMIA